MLNTVLREEWGFDGIVISDWWGTYSTSKSLNAGMDLEMPGPSAWRGKQLLEAVNCRKVSKQTVDKSVRRLLDIIKRTKAHEKRHVPEGTGEDTEDSRRLIRKAAADSIVLLKNDKKILPLQRDESTKYGLIGEHCKRPGNCGGGSSEVLPWYISTPFDAITEIVGSDNVRYEPGCDSKLSSLAPRLIFVRLTVTKRIAGYR
jgi:beta-glucosidase